MMLVIGISRYRGDRRGRKIALSSTSLYPISTIRLLAEISDLNSSSIFRNPHYSRIPWEILIPSLFMKDNNAAA
jgi:hypothetical protein